LQLPRRKISEYRSKLIINRALGLNYSGWEVSYGKVPDVPKDGRFVLKVDQAIKQRFKRGLIYLDLAVAELPAKVKDLTSEGFNYLLIEPYYPHDAEAERYISLRRAREGIVLSYSRSGGVEIEAAAASIKSGLVDTLDMNKVSAETGLAPDQLKILIEEFDSQYMSLLEINPYVIEVNNLKILDAAIEVDSAAGHLVDGWSEDDFRSPAATLTEEEIAVRKLNNESPASFSLEIINPDGEIFLLLSGGGASVVIADEIFTMGHGKSLANYGEYSGNPSTDETKLYTEQVMKLLLKSKAEKKVVLIGGAVANFTDIKNTFDGIISVLRKYSADLRKQGVKFYVRRGGPRQKEGLEAITRVLKELDILGNVYDPSTTIPAAVASLVKGLK
jgi:ATP-citrate lyase beta-subunit